MDSRTNQRPSSYVNLESNDIIVTRLAQQDKIPWYNKPNLRFLYLLMIPTCMGVEMTSGYDASMVNGLQAVPSWIEYYHHPRAASLGLMVSMYSLGCVAAVPFAPFIVDKLGRRYPMFLAGVLSSIGGILQGSAFNLMMFIIARFILGFSGVISLVAASALIAELSHPKERTSMTCLFNAFFYLGALSAAGVTFWTFAMTSNWGWRIPSLLQALHSLPQIVFIWFVPESPRWLISKRRSDEALAVLVKYHAEGDGNSEFVHAEYSQIEKMLEAGLAVAKMSRKKVFSTSGMRKRIIIATYIGLCNSWSGFGLISYFLSPILDNVGIHDNQTKNMVNLVRASWELINGTTIALIMPRYPRRTGYLACSISLFVVLVTFTGASAEYSFTQNKVFAKVVLALIFLHSPANNLGFGSLDCTFLTELFPFHVRTSGIAVYLWWFRAGAFFSLFMNPIGIDALGWRWYTIYCLWNTFQILFVYFTFPETSGRTLEELTFLFEDDRAVLRDSEAGVLREHGWTETYGSLEGQSSRRVAGGERG